MARPADQILPPTWIRIAAASGMWVRCVSVEQQDRVPFSIRLVPISFVRHFQNRQSCAVFQNEILTFKDGGVGFHFRLYPSVVFESDGGYYVI